LAQFRGFLNQHLSSFQRLIEQLPWKQPVTHRSDNALVKRILAGNHEACVELIRQYHAPIYRLLVHLCRDAHFAEDLAQETFLAAWAKIGSFNAASSLNTWLHRIAYRKFIDAHRRSERAVATRADAAIDQVQSNTPNPYDLALASEQTQRLYQALDRLKPAERDVLVLHYLQGLSYQEMADVLGQPTGTVKWRVRQALENLRRELENKIDK
jgi:RNA polymerase sigma-70 factor, ECF subfamily